MKKSKKPVNFRFVKKFTDKDEGLIGIANLTIFSDNLVDASVFFIAPSSTGFYDTVLEIVGSGMDFNAGTQFFKEDITGGELRDFLIFMYAYQKMLDFLEHIREHDTNKIALSSFNFGKYLVEISKEIEKDENMFPKDIDLLQPNNFLEGLGFSSG